MKREEEQLVKTPNFNMTRDLQTFYRSNLNLNFCMTCEETFVLGIPDLDMQRDLKKRLEINLKLEFKLKLPRDAQRLKAG